MKRSTLLSLCIVIASAFLAGFALLHPGLPPTHDGEYHVVRFYEFDKVLREGNLYPRWAPDLNRGYGVPLFNYVYPLPNYVASLFHFFGFSFIDAFKLSMFVATIIGGIFFYLWSKQYWNETGGVVSAIFYIFSPYRFVDIYIRGSVGEVWAMAFFPAFLWSVTMLFKKKNSLFVISSSLFLALIIFSHNILALMFLPFALSYITLLLYQAKNSKYLILNTLYIILFGLALSAVFWLPALFEQQYVTGLQIYDVSKNFADLYQLLIPSWGSGFSQGTLQNQMSFQIGIANLLAIAFGFLSIILLHKKKDKHVSVIAFFLCWFFLLFFLMLKASYPVWQYVPFMDYFQFPWRFLSLTILVASFLAGSIFEIRNAKILAVILIVSVIFLSIGYAKPAYYHQRNDQYYLTRSNFIDGTNSPGNYFNIIWFDTTLEKKKEKALISKGKGNIAPVFIKSTEYRFKSNISSESNIVVHTAYFPGWETFVDGKKIHLEKNSDGLITFYIPFGMHEVEVQFTDTIVRKSATTISLLSFLFMISYFFLHHRGIIFLKGLQ